MSRSIDDLFEPLRRVHIKAVSLMSFGENVFIITTCTQRSLEEQMALWYQGRASLAKVNRMRKKVELAPIKSKENRIVTKTKTSYHSTQPKSMAFDFYIAEWGKKIPIWNPKVDLNENDIPDYQEFADICKKLNPNIEWGGDWKFRDYGHIQWKDGLSLDQEKYMKELQPRTIKPRPSTKLGRQIRQLMKKIFKFLGKKYYDYVTNPNPNG